MRTIIQPGDLSARMLRLEVSEPNLGESALLIRRYYADFHDDLDLSWSPSLNDIGQIKFL